MKSCLLACYSSPCLPFSLPLRSCTVGSGTSLSDACSGLWCGGVELSVNPCCCCDFVLVLLLGFCFCEDPAASQRGQYLCQSISTMLLEVSNSLEYLHCIPLPLTKLHLQYPLPSPKRILIEPFGKLVFLLDELHRQGGMCRCM